MSTDRIEKSILLRATRKRVWRALTDSTEFGTWFGVKFDGPFAPGARMRGVIVPTTVNAEVAKAQKEYEGLPFDIVVERIEPERLFSFRWYPNAVERGVDYSAEPATLVVFSLEEVPDGVMLTITESGFDRIPLARRAKAFTANEKGWGLQAKTDRGIPCQNAVAHTLSRSRRARPACSQRWVTRPAYGLSLVFVMTDRCPSPGSAGASPSPVKRSPNTCASWRGRVSCAAEDMGARASGSYLRDAFRTRAATLR